MGFSRQIFTLFPTARRCSAEAGKFQLEKSAFYTEFTRIMVKRLVARERHREAMDHALRHNPVVALVGPRQSGKTTLARQIRRSRNQVHYFDLENPEDLMLLDNPMQGLKDLSGLIIIDEVQRKPDLFPILRVLADRQPLRARFLVLGSASGHLLRQTSESLAGRIAFLEMPGFDFAEITPRPVDRLWLRGGFPRSFLATDEQASFEWRQQFIRTFLERDILQLGVHIPPLMLHRFWTMVSHYHGQTGNNSDLGRSLGVADTTIRRYLDLLSDAFMIRQLPPWFENVGKRLVKAPKIYLRDSGLFHALQRIRNMNELRRHPKLGASWEGFALEQVARLHRNGDLYFYATQAGAELDLLMVAGERRYGFEFKYADAPTMTRSMHIALRDLKLKQLWVIYPGSRSYPLHARVNALPLTRIADLRF